MTMNGMICVACGKTAKPSTLRVDNSQVPGWECPCGEEYLDGAAVETLLSIKRLQKEHLVAKVTRQGNSYALRVPMEVVDAYHLKNRKELKIAPENHRIVFEVPT